MESPKSHEGPPGFWDRPEQSLLDAGKDGELLIAKIRVALTFVLLLVPLADIITAASEGREQHFIGFVVTASACVLSVGIYFLVISDRRQRWLPLATSLFDVSFITLTLILYGLLVGPVVLTNNRLSFDTYFLALGATCLRYDKRIALIAGLVAIAQWIGSVLFVLAHSGAAALAVDEFYGRFAWSDQISRVVLLATATALNVFIVAGIQKQRKLSTADALTGVHNRRFLDDFLRNELARAARHETQLAVAMIDVDHFKQFNDTHGHAAGDRALKQVAQTLELAVRRTDLVARYGGEEFVVVLPDSPTDQAIARMNAIREAIESEPLMLAWKDGRSAPARLTVSIGVTSWTDEKNHTASELIAEADSNLYRAKKGGRNRVVGPAD
ncbi:MAG TPA: GGDEF domain-containing protein [Gemmatimonadaceae bacterium]|jgi:diguanylate cyclase (GGDEF)-like protein|nr:GGDEF domain-containing protein [Gemmatimonadaceae bacterium]